MAERMTERPIRFSAPMVRAILEGRKTQTRRVIKITGVSGKKVSITSPDERLIELESGEFQAGVFHYLSTGGLSGPYRLPWKRGDTLWVKETFATDGVVVRYAATDDIHELRKKKPSIFMPRWASRITLKVTDVRVQRLQEISNTDAIAEGCGVTWSNPHPEKTREPFPCLVFRDLWASIHTMASWEANPWVAAITFERVKP